jgi:hypothetical protein
MVRVINGVVSAPNSSSINFGAQTSVSISVLNRSDDSTLGQSTINGVNSLPLNYQVEFEEESVRKEPNGQFELVVRMEVDSESDFVAETQMPIVDHDSTESFSDMNGNTQDFSYAILSEINVELALNLGNLDI